MQHKGLFVALCCGALCLTGCIKNIESESVTKIREATASKLLSEAELNKAQAEAAKIKANAEATIAEAQAKLIEAQAAKEEAEAKLIEAKAELQKINNEIAKVKLDEEREELKRKKAEVEKQIAEYEAAIAWAQASQAAAIQKMEDMANEAEINALKHQVEILQQKQNIVAEASKLNSDLRKRLIHVWDKYNHYSDEYYTAQAELIKAQTELAKLEAQMETNYEATVEAIVAKQNEIAFLELQLEELESYVTFSSDEIKEALKLAEMKVAEVKSAELNAYHTFDIATKAFNALEKEEYAYTAVWEPLVAFVNDPHFKEYFAAYVPMQMELGSRKYAGLGYMGQFFPLFTGTYNKDDSGKFEADTKFFVDEGDLELYPESVDGKKPTYHYAFRDRIYVAPYLDTENFEELLAIADETIDEYEEKKIDEFYKSGDEDLVALRQITKKTLPGLVEKFNYYTEYVEAAEPEVTPLETAFEAAGEIWEEKLEDVKEAGDAVKTYMNVHEVEIKAKPLVEAEMKALAATLVAQDKVSDTQIAFNAAVENLKALKAKVQEIADAKFAAEILKASSQHAVDSLKDVVLNPTKAGSVGQVYEKAQKAVVEQRQNINLQEAATAKSLEDYRAAEVAYITDPSTDERAAKKSVWEADTAKLGKLNRDLIPMLEDLQKAETPFQKAVDECLFAESTNAEATKDVKIYTASLETAIKQLGEPEDPKTEEQEATGAFKKVADAKKANDEAKATLAEKIAAYKQAHADNTQGEVSEEFVQLTVDALNAIDDFYAATRVVGEAFSELYTVVTTKYPYLVQYSYQIDPKYSDWDGIVTDDKPEQLYALIAWNNAKASILEQKVADKVEKIHDDCDAIRKHIAPAKQALSIIENTEEEFFAHVVELNEADDAWILAYKDYIDAQNAAAEIEAEYRMLIDLDLLHMGMYEVVTPNPAYNKEIPEDPVTNPRFITTTLNITEVETAIGNLKTEIATAEKELEALIDDANLGIEINETTHVRELEAYTQLVAKIERLESEINQYLALMDAYSAEIDIIMEAIESEADVD